MLEVALANIQDLLAEYQSVAVPNVTAPNVTAPNVTVPDVTAPNVTAPNGAVEMGVLCVEILLLCDHPSNCLSCFRSLTTAEIKRRQVCAVSAKFNDVTCSTITQDRFLLNSLLILPPLRHLKNTFEHATRSLVSYL
jgi:hypothetical protein